MTRKFKTLGVAFVAMLALSAIAASAASAEKQYTCSAYPCTGTGESVLGNDTFTTEAGTVECKAHFEGTLNAASSHLTVKANYNKETCKFGPLAAHVQMNSCDYTFETPKSTGKADEFTAPVKVTCGATPIVITAGTCEVHVGEQTPAGGATITNDTAAGDVTVKANFTGITYNVTKDGFGCPFAGTGLKHGGTYIQHNPITFDSTRNIHVG